MSADRRDVLVVDDEPSMRLLARINLEFEGFRVREAASGEEAIAILETDEPAVVLLDIGMKGIDGWAVVDWLEARGRLVELSVIVVSAHASGHMIELARKKGLRYIKKPFRIDQLIEAVTEAAG